MRGDVDSMIQRMRDLGEQTRQNTASGLLQHDIMRQVADGVRAIQVELRRALPPHAAAPSMPEPSAPMTSSLAPPESSSTRLPDAQLARTTTLKDNRGVNPWGVLLTGPVVQEVVPSVDVPQSHGCLQTRRSSRRDEELAQDFLNMFGSMLLTHLRFQNPKP